MREIATAIPDVGVLLALEPEELGAKLLFLGRYGGINEDFVLVDGWRKGEAESL